MNGKAIHRKQVSVHEAFYAPKNVTFGYQAARESFSVWFEEGAANDIEYTIVGTGDPIARPHKLRATATIDGFYTFHLVELL